MMVFISNNKILYVRLSKLHQRYKYNVTISWHVFRISTVLNSPNMHFDINKFYSTAYNWILAFGPRLIAAIIFFVVAQWTIRILKRGMNKALFKKNISSSLKPFLVSLTAAILQVLTVLVVLQILNLRLTIFTAIVGGISVAAGLALSGTLQNFTSGVLILLLKPYRSGDTIVAQGYEGIVKSIQIFYTLINTYDNKTVVVPNSKLSNEVIVNLSRETTRRLDISLKLGFGIDFDKIKNVVNDTIKNFPGITSNPKPDLGIAEVLADGYRVELNVWVSSKDFHKLRNSLQEKLICDMKKAEIKLPGT
ncbi:mechanosensitive ion channel family protein [Panacibacter ginsenosidivorans]|uniref:Mechanosensitive ion channel family protein n=1 Tax=Panacibacter ginsenosidivorans TaxID=1813871 RepID=A0A5B8V5L6_9BACT|nr:mechanosensitive ion channel family protein [Panacibacter ginsenosidivorans]QEC66684.1 mechanosensitive ion channel family protein [Panacibacter ginsenosidivorans]